MNVGVTKDYKLRDSTMRGSGQDMVQNDQTQRASVYMM
jgi:hypothetical protein